MIDGLLSICQFLLRLSVIGSILAGAAWADGPWVLGPLTNGKIELKGGADVMEISFPTDNIVEFDYRPDGKSGPHSPVLAGFKGSVSPVQAPGGTSPGKTVFTTAGMNVEVTTPLLDIKISDPKGKVLCEVPAIGSGGGIVKHDPAPLLGNVGDTVWAGFQGINGGPFVWTTTGFGVLWDSDGGAVMTGDARGPNDSQIDITRDPGTNYPRPDFDMYVIVGPPRAILEGYADISGHAPMFPKWNMGFMVTHWGIDEKEQLQNVDLFRSKKIPFDTYIIDYDSFNYGQGDLGDFEWNTTNFPDGPSGKLCKDLLASKGVKMVAIRKPRLSAAIPGPEVNAAVAKGWVLPKPNGQPDGTKEFNYHIPEARAWWWSKEQPLFESGLAGYWNDEADVAGNFHFMEMAETEYEGQRSVSNQRVWTLNRNFYTGSQRYAYGLWSGDIGTGFQSMADQRLRMMQAICGGELWWTMDSGGFHGHPTPENYARWIQFAAFAPIMRVHGEKPETREPWNYGPQAEAIAKKYIELRYRLMPYLYAGAWQISAHGLPLIRPMWIDYSDDSNVTTKMTDQWMIGDSLLARPIVDPGATSAKVYLPRGTWIDYWTGEIHPGGQWIDRPVNAQSWDDMPLYVKRGAIIPTAPPLLYVGQAPIDPLTVEIYPDAEQSSFSYYDDDGQTYDYEKGVYAELPMTCQLIGNGIVYSTGAQKGTFNLPTKTCVLKFHLLDDKRKAQGVTVNGQPLAQAASPEALNVKETGWTETSDASGPVIVVRAPMAASRRVEVTLK